MDYKTLQQKHRELDREIKLVYKEVLRKYKFKEKISPIPGITVIANIIGKKLRTTGQTVKNYCKGGGKDGYLKEAILANLKIHLSDEKI